MIDSHNSVKQPLSNDNVTNGFDRSRDIASELKLRRERLTVVIYEFGMDEFAQIARIVAGNRAI